ncbi:MAG: DUF1588 domain-containing protein, partial [Planctomycetota bacterium]
EKISQEKLRRAVEFLFESLTLRPPTPEETRQYVALANEAITDLGKDEGVVLGLVPIFLDPNALFRLELAKSGTPDEYGRTMLQGWELGLAINGAFSYLGPDEELQNAVMEGRLVSREDVKREVERILADDSVRKPRVLQFFREYFDYDIAGKICKDEKALQEATKGNATRLPSDMYLMAHSLDRLVELIVAEDKDVLRELLTTNRVISRSPETIYFSQWENLKVPPKRDRKDKSPKPKPNELGHTMLPKGERIYVRTVNGTGRSGDSGEARTLTTMPEGQRLGILTHPAWLVSHSDAMDNHAIHRGIWVRERLLGDAVPDVPITVDAMLPDEPGTTLRHRMRVTSVQECWRCHQKMDPLGMPFEMYNHLGLFRTTELGEPVDTSGEIIHSGDPALDGPVTDALDMIRKLADSERVEQVFVRHAFRFWIGRNETIEDAPVLQDAWHAYRDNGGSMKALITSLVTSDAFLYRSVERKGGLLTESR